MLRVLKIQPWNPELRKYNRLQNKTTVISPTSLSFTLKCNVVCKKVSSHQNNDNCQHENEPNPYQLRFIISKEVRIKKIWLKLIWSDLTIRRGLHCQQSRPSCIFFFQSLAPFYGPWLTRNLLFVFDVINRYRNDTYVCSLLIVHWICLKINRRHSKA